MVTFAQQTSPDLQPVKNVLAKILVKLSRKNPVHNGYLQSTAKDHWLLPQATFCRQMKQIYIYIYVFRKYIYILKVISF